jgi:DNA helicase-2/ATP-dependent DNA helicase PcrA
MTTPTFVPSLEQQVIAHRGGNLQLVPCAGAGKTEAISWRVPTLIEEGVEPAQVVAFTFTERAATSLKNRITRRATRSPSP